MVAKELLATNPSGAESIVRMIPKPESRVSAYIELAAALPDEQRAQERKLLELATVDIHDPAVNVESRHVRLGRVAQAWLNLGDVDKARPLIREGFELLGVLPKRMPQSDDRFLSSAARIEPDRVLSLIASLGAAERQPYYARIVDSLAIEHPAEAERVFQLCDSSPRTEMQIRSRIALQLRLCLRLATSDPAQRGASSQESRCPEIRPPAGHSSRSGLPIVINRPLARPWPSQFRSSIACSICASREARSHRADGGHQPRSTHSPDRRESGAGTPGRGLLEGCRPDAE